MNKYLIPVVASVLIVTMLLASSMPIVQALRPVIGPKLDVTTIPEDDQKREKGIILLGLNGAGFPKGYSPGKDLLSQHKLLVTYNGRTIQWRIGDVGLIVSWNVLEKDKVNPIDDKFGTPTRKFPEENLVTKLVDVTDHFICKARWKTPANMPGWYESAGVLDCYYIGPAVPGVIADNILVVRVGMLVGRTPVVGVDMQDICLLGWSMSENYRRITLPNGGETIISHADSLGRFVSCEEAALAQRDYLGVRIQGVEQ